MSRSRSDGRCTPGRPWVRPPVSTIDLGAVGRHVHDAHADRAVAEDQPVADLEVVEQGRVVDVHRAGVAVAVAGPYGQVGAGDEGDATLREPAGTDLRTGEVGEHADRAPDALGGGPHHREPGQVLVERAVAEVEAHDVDAGAQQPLERFGLVGRRPDGGDDLRSAGHAALLIRQHFYTIARHPGATRCRPICAAERRACLSTRRGAAAGASRAARACRDHGRRRRPDRCPTIGRAQADRLADYLADRGRSPPSTAARCGAPPRRWRRSRNGWGCR